MTLRDWLARSGEQAGAPRRRRTLERRPPATPWPSEANNAHATKAAATTRALLRCDCELGNVTSLFLRWLATAKRRLIAVLTSLTPVRGARASRSVPYRTEDGAGRSTTSAWGANDDANERRCIPVPSCYTQQQKKPPQATSADAVLDSYFHVGGSFLARL